MIREIATTILMELYSRLSYSQYLLPRNNFAGKKFAILKFKFPLYRIRSLVG